MGSGDTQSLFVSLTEPQEGEISLI